MPAVPASPIPQERLGCREWTPGSPVKLSTLSLVEIKGWKKRGHSASQQKRMKAKAADKLSWIQKLKPQGNQLHWDDRKRRVKHWGGERAGGTHLSSRSAPRTPAPPRGGVAAGPPPHLEADPTHGAAGRTTRSRGSSLRPAGRSNRVTGVNLREAQPLSAPAPRSPGGSPHGDHWRMGYKATRARSPWEAMQCTALVEPVTLKSIPAPNLIFESKRKLESQVLHVLANNLKNGLH